MVGVFCIGILSACGKATPAISEPPIPSDSLETAEAYMLREDRYAETQDYDYGMSLP